MSGKGSKRRPLGVSEEVFANNWEAIFGPVGGKREEPRSETPEEVQPVPEDAGPEEGLPTET